MTAVYRRLAALGFPRKYVQRFALPAWWDAEIAETPTGLATTLLSIARRLGVDYSSLVGDEPARLADAGLTRFKHNRGVDATDLQVTQRIVSSAAKLVARGCETPLAIPADFEEARAAILDRHDAVTLGTLTEYCWSIGVPVLHITQFPAGQKKMSGFVSVFHGRPVIVIAKAAKYSSVLLFILAHELGHVLAGHVRENCTFVDSGVAGSAGDGNDAEEREADELAIGLLTGDPMTEYVAGDRWLNAETLAEAAEVRGREAQVDPGHVALNYAHTMDFHAVGFAALRILEPQPKGAKPILEALVRHFDWSALREDDADYLVELTGCDGAPRA